jgi:hypothetical protein
MRVCGDRMISQEDTLDPLGGLRIEITIKLTHPD